MTLINWSSSSCMGICHKRYDFDLDLDFDFEGLRQGCGYIFPLMASSSEFSLAKSENNWPKI
jgi:hypothetical protein